jgi:uncharacterized protein (TIGR02145 family)
MRVGKMKMRVFEKNKGFLAQAIAFAMASFWVTACTSSNEDGGFAGGTTEDAGIIADLNVAGLAQKGPFVKGSVVTLQGVDCKTMEFTDEVFEGAVINNDGEYVVENVNLSVTCALLEVTGYYLNENTGKKSTGEISLHALTDLSDRKNVNINVFTELEYKRVMNLVTEKKMSFANAKKQAEKEVLTAFDVNAKEGDFASFEDLDVFEKGKENVALHDVGVMLQADLNATEFAERLENIAADIAKDGKWDDRDSVIPASSGNLPSSSSSSSSSSVTQGPGTSSGINSVEGSSSSSFNDSTKDSYLNPDIEYGEMIDSRDGQVYKTVKIGNQVWMAENLNYETEKSYCYNDSTEYCAMYGRFYEWNAAMRACPEGWHLPLLEEFKTLVDALGDSAMAGSKLKSTSGWLNDLNGTDDYGFTVLPIGGRSASGKYINKEWLADFWSSTESAVEFAYVMHLGAYFNTAPLDMDEGKYNAFSVRCLQGENDSLKSYIFVEDSAVAACKTESTDDCEYGKLTDERNGQEYKTVKIGKQVWMAENLNYETDESYCYNDSAEYCTKYGRLYTWSAALNACPTGWHLPSQNEGMTLYYSVGGRDTAAKMLKSVNGWNDDGAGTDSFGFSALPVGDRDEFNDYENEGRFAGFWTSTEVNERYAAHIHLFYMDDDAALSTTFNKRYAYAVRCVKD